MKRILALFGATISVVTVFAQRYNFSEPKLDASRKADSGTVVVEILSHSDNLVLKWQLSDKEGERKVSSDGSYIYSLTYNLKEEDEGFAKSKISLSIQEVSTSSEAVITFHDGEIFRGSFDLNNLMFEERTKTLYAADKKARIMFDSQIGELSIDIDKINCFKDGKALSGLAKGMTAQVTTEDGTYHYDIIIPVTPGQPWSPKSFRVACKEDECIIPGKTFENKDFYHFSVSSIIKTVEHVTTYEEYLQEFEKEKALVNSYTMSSQFLHLANIAQGINKHPDCPDELRDEWLQKENHYLKIRKTFYSAETFIKNWEKLSEEKGPTDQDAIKYLGGARKAFYVLNEQNPDVPYFAQQFEKYDKILDKYHQKTVVTNVEVKYPIVTGKVYFNEGEWVLGNVSGIGIYGAHHSLYKPKKNELKNLPIVGRTGADGSFRIVLRDPNINYLYFSGCKSSVSIEPNKTQDIIVQLSD